MLVIQEPVAISNVPDCGDKVPIDDVEKPNAFEIAREKCTGFECTIPEGYQSLPVKYFKKKGIVPPLVSISWFSCLSSDEEPEEDSLPLARLKVRLNKEEEGEEKCKKKKGDTVDRKRGRPRKCQEPGTQVEEFKVTKEEFWDSQSDSSNFEAQVHEEAEVPVVEEDNESTHHVEHSYFKSTETPEAKEEPKNTKVESKSKKENGVKTSFPCLECGKKFSAANTLKSHQRIHNGTLLTCTECQKGFITKYLLKCHMRIHNGDLFTCQKCGKGFTTAEVLKIHSRCHTGDKPFVCDICCKSFPSASNLSQHKQIHNPEKTFLCSQCGSSFSLKRNLEFHMLTHAEKSHICNVCGKLWARKAYLIEHMRVHTGVKPFCCNLCPQKFTQASSLKRHQIVHVDDKPIKCDTCDKKFKSQNYYKRHLRKHLKGSD